MIKLQFSVAVALYILGVLGLLFLLWLYAEIKKKRPLSNSSRILWECSICAQVYWEESDMEISQCPHCQSFNQKNEKARFNLNEERESERVSQVTENYQA